MYGELDSLRSNVPKLESVFERIDTIIVPNAPHACYMYDSVMFNHEIVSLGERLMRPEA